MKAAQQKRGIKVRTLYPDGTTKEFNTMLGAAKDCGLNIGSVANAIKTHGTCKMELVLKGLKESEKIKTTQSRNLSRLFLLIQKI